MEPFAKSLALVVGVDIYEDGIPSLRNACNDARAISNVLKDWHGYTIEAQLLNIEASRDSLQNEIRKLHDELTQHDRLLFYFAGHGVSLNGVEGPNGYILLSDAIRDDEQSFFLMSDLSESLRSLPCRHLLVVLDCCFAGAMGWSSLRHVGIQTEQLTRELYARYTEKPAWQALSSAAHDERALDVDRRTLAFTRQSYTFAQRPESEDADNSPFAKALIRGLSGKADLYPKSEEGDGIITAHELFVFVDGCLRNLEPHQQTPVLWPLKWPSVGQYVFKVPGSETEIDDLPSAVELTEELNPYQGLEPFTQQESDLFFGRDELTNGLIDRVKNDPLTVVTGASGSGKSSLVRAGLIPEMQEEQEWLILPVIRPLGSLSQALTPLLEMLKIDPDTLDKQGIHALEEPWRDWVKRHAGHRCLLVIDQFEEMITQWQSERDVRRAIHLLREAQVRFGDQLHMVFTIRADFEAGFRGDLESHQDENSKLWTADNLFRVRRMNQAELRAVILKPAASRTLFVDSEVVDGLVEEVFDAPGALPLLSFTLKEMYRSYVADPDGTRELTETHYKNVGGIHGALPKRAESLYRALSRDEKTTLRHVMLRMVTRDAGELVRRRVPRSELTYPGNENKRATAVLRRLQEARLVVTDKAAICGKVGEQRAGMERETASFVEPAHDALIRSWKRLGDWVKREDQREDDIAFQRRLTSSAKTWHTEHYETPHIFKDSRSIWRGIRHVVERAMMWRESTERKGHLYDDASRSDLLAEILDREQPWFNSLETEFTRASIHQNRLNTRIIVGTVIGFVGLAVVILFLGLVANNRGSQLLSRGLAARAEAELSQPEEADPAQALGLAYEAILADRTDQAECALSRALFRSRLQSILSHEDPVRNATFNQDETRIATTSGKYVYVWRLHEEKRTESHWIREDTLAHHESVEIAKFSSDGGSHILTAAGDTAYLWRQSAIGSGTGGQWEKEDILVGHSGDVRNATFAPSGSRILTSVDTAAYVWRQQDQDDAGRWKQEAVLENWGWSFVGATFGSEGSHILTVNSKGSASQLDSAAYVWRWMDGENGGRWEEADSLGGHPSFVRYAAFSPDESRIVTASNDSAYVWRRNGEGGVDKWEMEDVLGGHSGPVETASFSPDGMRVMTVSQGRTRIWRWHGERGEHRWKVEAVLGSESEPLSNVAFSQDGSHLVAATNRTAMVWARMPDNSWKQSDVLEGHIESLGHVTFNADGSRVLTASRDGTARVWWIGNAAQTAEYARVWSPSYPTYNMKADRVLAVQKYSVHVWKWDDNAQDGERWRNEAILGGHSRPISEAFFSTDGSRILAVGDGVVRSWKWRHGSGYGRWELETILEDPDFEQTITSDRESVEFDADGVRVAARSDTVVHIWRMRSRDDSSRLWARDGILNHSEVVWDTWFSPDNSFLLTTTSASAHVWRWHSNPDGGRWVEEDTLYHPGGLGVDVAFAPDGARIATVGEDSVFVWTLHKKSGIRQWRREDALPEATQYVSFSPDGMRALATTEGSQVRLWRRDIRSERWNEETVPEGSGLTENAFFSSHGSRIVVVRDGSLHVWRYAEDNGNHWEVDDIVGPLDSVEGSMISSGGDHIATLSGDVATVWRRSSGRWQVQRVFRHPGARRMAFSQNGRRMIIISPGSAGMYELDFQSLIQDARSRLPTHLDEVEERDALVGY